MARKGCTHCNDSFLEMEEARLARQEQVRKHREGLLKADDDLKAYRKEEVADALEVKQDREGITDGKVAKETLEAFEAAEEERAEEIEHLKAERIEKLEAQTEEGEGVLQTSTTQDAQEAQEEEVKEEAPKVAPKTTRAKKTED